VGMTLPQQTKEYSNNRKHIKHTENINQGNGINHSTHSKKYHNFRCPSIPWKVNSKYQGAKNMWKMWHSSRDFTFSNSMSNAFKMTYKVAMKHKIIIN
jgi:hypothetical protein